MRVCNVHGCGNLFNGQGGRCTAHSRAYERIRGTRQQRGYDAAHDNLRAQWAALVAQGTVTCWRCHKLISPGEPWDLGHDDHDRSQHRGPEHTHCNRATRGR